MSVSHKSYFPGLDGLRFFAFLLVFLHHSSLYLRFDVSKNIFWKFFQDNGWIGVDIFFVLTGFLVTLLLLEERKIYKKFSLKIFTIKRILRIWPLYFLALAVGFVIAMQNGLEINLPWYLIFLGNWGVVLNGYGDLRHVSQLWAVSLDQQFYILWPLALLFLRNFKTSLIISLLIIFSSVVLRSFLVNSGVAHPAIYVNTFARLDTFIMGGVLALMIFYKPTLLDKFQKFYHPLLQVTSIILLAVFLYFVTKDNRLAIRNGVFGYLVISLITTYIILFTIKTNSFIVKTFNLEIFKYLGRISYGLYVWHVLALEILFYLITKAEFTFLIPTLGLPLTILFGFISYKFFEKPFLTLKSRFK